MTQLEYLDSLLAQLGEDVPLSAEEEADPKTRAEIEEFEGWCRYDAALSNYYAALAKVPEEKLEEFIYGPSRRAALALEVEPTLSSDGT